MAWKGACVKTGVHEVYNVTESRGAWDVRKGMEVGKELRWSIQTAPTRSRTAGPITLFTLTFISFHNLHQTSKFQVRV